jgi:CRISPR-associated endonuclease Cas2
MSRQLFLVCYDIPDNPRRRRVFQRVQGHRLEGQLSAHECWLYPAELEHLLNDLAGIMNSEQDRLHILQCSESVARGPVAETNPDTVWIWG